MLVHQYELAGATGKAAVSLVNELPSPCVDVGSGHVLTLCEPNFVALVYPRGDQTAVLCVYTGVAVGYR